MLGLRMKLETLLESGSVSNRRPALGKDNESNVRGLHIIGDLAGAPVIKLAMAQAVDVIEAIAARPEMQTKSGADTFDVQPGAPSTSPRRVTMQASRSG